MTLKQQNRFKTSIFHLINIRLTKKIFNAVYLLGSLV